MKVFLYVFAACSGLMNAVQSGCNSMLGKSIGQMPAAVVIGLVTTASAVAFGLVSGQLAWPSGADAQAAGVLVAAQVGSGVFIALTVTATVTMSLVLDHYGLLGFDVRPASWGRIAGALFMFAGLGLIAKF